MYSTGSPFSSHSSRHETPPVQRPDEQALDSASVQPLDTTRELNDAFKKMLVPSSSASDNLPNLVLEEPAPIGPIGLMLASEMMYGTMVNIDKNQYLSRDELKWGADAKSLPTALIDISKALLENYQDASNASNDEYGPENDGISGFDMKAIFEPNSQSNVIIAMKVVHDFNERAHNRYSNHVLLKYSNDRPTWADAKIAFELRRAGVDSSIRDTLVDLKGQLSPGGSLKGLSQLVAREGSDPKFQDATDMLSKALTKAGSSVHLASLPDGGLLLYSQHYSNAYEKFNPGIAISANGTADVRDVQLNSRYSADQLKVEPGTLIGYNADDLYRELQQGIIESIYQGAFR